MILNYIEYIFNNAIFQVLSILNKEREALLKHLDYWETEDVEKKYIFEALGLLSTRENLLINEDPVSF